MYLFFCAIVLYLVVYHVCFQDGKLCLLVANDKLDGIVNPAIDSTFSNIVKKRNFPRHKQCKSIGTLG
jgi:ABC-type Co2+ transport system permease subunit